MMTGSDRMGILCVVVLLVAASLVVPLMPAQKANANPAPQGEYVSDQILLKKLTFSTSAGEPEIPTHLKMTAYPEWVSGVYIVQMRGPIKENWKSQLSKYCEVLSYIPWNAYTVKATFSQMEEIAKLPFVKWYGIYQPYYKVDNTVYTAPSQTLKILVFDNLYGVAMAIRKGGGVLKEVTPSMYGEGGTIVAEMPSKLAEKIAFLPDVRWIEKQSEMKISNSISAGVIQSGTSGNTPIWNKGLYGDGQIIGESDTGIDWDHEAFRDPSHYQVQYSNPPGSLPPDLQHRKIVNYHVFVDDYDLASSGHGTHVACTIAGNNSYVGGTNANGKGMAPRAKLSFTDIGGPGDSLMLPADLNQLFLWAYNDGARLHSNSWGSSSNDYTIESMQADEFMWNHKDMLILFAAGNSGSGANTVGSPGTAKNIVTVGATSNDGTSLASFSSRGPTADGRRKPTVCAPGVSIDSADSDGVKNSNNSGYISMDGTSMATPTTAGGAALVRQYYTEGWYPTGTKISGNGFTPSGALIKATLINSAVTLGTYTIPDNNIGWGRINLDRALYFSGDTERLRIVDFTGGLQTGDSMEYMYYVSGSSVPLRITLVWTDYPGDAAAAKDIVNDLNLAVTAPDGAQYLGNVFSGGQSTTGGTADNTNVEECVYLNTPQTGLYKVKITAANVPMGPQDFALVVTGALSDAQGEVHMDKYWYPATGVINLKVVDPDASGTVSVQVNSTTEPGGETVTLSETASNSHVFIGTLHISQTNANGVLQVSHGDIITARYDDASAPVTAVYAYAKVDDLPPSISNVFVEAINGNYAEITWKTDEPATSVVKYGTGTPTNSIYSNDTSTNHRVRLYGLQPNTTYVFDVESADTAGNLATDTNGGMHYRFTTIMASVLVVDGGMDPKFDKYYTDALQDTGWSYGIWRKAKQGMPSLTYLQQFKAVVWHTSDCYPQLSADDRSLLGSYLDAGGKLIISGQDIGWDLCATDGTQYNNTTWYQNYLHATYSADNDGSYTVNGVSGDPIGNGITASLQDVVGGFYPDRVSARTGAYAFLKYSSGNTAGVRYLGAHGVVYYAFAFEDITSRSIRATLMDRSLIYLLGGSKPTVSITAPGENSSAYDVVDITWVANDTKTITKFDLYLSADEGQSWAYLATTTGNSYTVNLSPYPVGAYKVKVVAIDNTGLDGSASVRVIKTLDDVGVESIITPINENSYLQGEQTVTAKIKNYGPNTQPSFNARCTIWKVLPGTETVVFEDDFETDKGWTHQNTGGNAVDQWARGTPSGSGAPTPHSGSNVWATNLAGNYANTYSAALISPALDLSGYDYATMKYWQWVDMEIGSTVVYDGGLIEITTDGSTWTQIDQPTVNPQPYYNGTISSGYSNPLAGKKAYSGNVKTWVEVTVNLTNWVGNSNVKVRFNFGSDSMIAYLGWYIDDVQVIGKKNTVLTEKFNQTKPTGTTMPQNAEVSLDWIYNFNELGRYKITVATELGIDIATGNDAKTIYINVVSGGTILINHTPVTTANIGEAINIYANVTAGTSPITDVKVFYQPVGSNTSMAVAMTLISGNTTNGTWYGQIPAQSTPGTLYYYIWAQDSASNTATLPETGNFTVIIQPVTEFYGTYTGVLVLCLLAIVATGIRKRKN
ncbi:MAG: S8 family serine peptidase [Thermoplasmata archaeon]|nr:S8 family serine peptidase [Thermoplasmata archaeon]